MKNRYWLVICSFIVMSCNNRSVQNTEMRSSEKITATPGDARDTLPNETILLNNGEKWIVNKEMKPYIQAGENLLSAYVAAHSEDYKNLAEQLKEKNSLLIKSCTMQGKSHEELHKWLHPHLDLVVALGKAESQQQANELVAQLQQSFHLFHQYFQ